MPVVACGHLIGVDMQGSDKGVALPTMSALMTFSIVGIHLWL